MTEAMDLTLSVEEQRTQELLRERRTAKKINDESDAEYENLFRRQGMVKI